MSAVDNLSGKSYPTIEVMSDKDSERELPAIDADREIKGEVVPNGKGKGEAFAPPLSPPMSMIKTSKPSGCASAGSPSAAVKGLSKPQLKKLTEIGRATSQPQENKQSGEALKRPRDDSEKDDNPRERKRPTPPLPAPKSPTSTKASGPDVDQQLTPVKAEAEATDDHAGLPALSDGSEKNKAKQPSKRPRDDSDKDENPRETKRPSPPRSPPKSPTSTKATKPNGFMAYATAASPFASLKGRNVFSSKSAAGPTTLKPTALAFGSSTVAAKRSGFEAFASSSSLLTSFVGAKSATSTFKLGRAKSPPQSIATSPSPFASYAEAPITADFGKAEHDSGEESEEEAETFGKSLRATKDNNDNDGNEGKPRLTARTVPTGEEEEKTIHQVRGKLFSLQGSSWKERGAGILKLNVKRKGGTGARLVMRKDVVYTLMLNITLFPGMSCTLAQDPRYLRFTAIESGVVTTYNLKMANAQVARHLFEEIHTNIPS